jgi:hypothetical protein
MLQGAVRTVALVTGMVADSAELGYVTKGPKDNYMGDSDSEL